MSAAHKQKPAAVTAGIKPKETYLSENSTTTKGVKLFDFDGAAVRVIIKNGQPWFVAADVCEVLGIQNSRDTLRKRLEDDEKGVATIYTSSEKGAAQNRSVAIVSESGLYALIFASTKPEAKKFRKWITSVVLPAIRKTGRYEFKREDLQDVPEAALLNYNVQRDCSKIMAKAVDNRDKIIGLRTDTCKAVTGKHPKELRLQGEVMGLKSRERESALQVLRSIGDINASVVASVNLMLADGADFGTAIKQKDKLATVFAELRGALLAGGLNERRFSSLSRAEIAGLMNEYQERKRALDLQLAFDFMEPSEEN